jgi:quercetin dioxygenase-like cupin family protein
VGELNGQHIRLVKIVGNELQFHKHNKEFERNSVILNGNEFVIVPIGTIHRPVAEKEAHLMMFVTNSNVNTGDIVNKFTLITGKLDII